MRRIDSVEVLNSNLKFFEGTTYNTNSFFFEKELNSLINADLLWFDLFDEILLLYKYVEELDFYEVYYYIKNSLSSVNIADNETFVMEIPYRSNKGFPSEMVGFWCNAGFDTHIDRCLLGLVRPETSFFILPNPEFEYTFVNNLELSRLICNNIKNAFDLFTGDILPEDEIVSAIKKREIIGAYKKDMLCGFIRFYSKNKVSWIGHLVVMPDFKGKGIGESLVSIYLKMRTEQGFTKFQQWVVSNNKPAIKLYSKFGFKSVNKNSISLIKTKNEGVL